MLSKSVAFILLLAAHPFGFAQDKKEDWPVGSAVWTLMESTEQLVSLDIELDNQNNELVEIIERKKVNPDLRLPRAVSDQNESWKKSRSADCYLGSAIDGGGGAWPEANAIVCEVQLTNIRIKLLRSTEKCIEALETPQVFEGASCLRALRTYSKTLQP